MSTNTLALEQKRALSDPNKGWLWQHATVKPTTGEQHLQTNGLSQDFSQVSTQTTLCPATPTRCSFGGACHTCPVHVQEKLKVSEPDDEYEREADRVADLVTRMPEPKDNEKEQCHLPSYAPTLQRRASNTVIPDDVPSIVQEVLRSPGQPLDSQTRAFMEPRFGHDFRSVRVHLNNKAAESTQKVSALAYTVGHHVVFGEGKYLPVSHTSQVLLAHELMHVVQQSCGNADKRPRPLILAGSSSENVVGKNGARLESGKLPGTTLKSRSTIARKDKPKEARRKKTYWFQEQPPAKKIVTAEGIEIEPKEQVVLDLRKRKISAKGIGTFYVQFTGMNYDFKDYEGAEPKAGMEKAENLIIKAIGGLIEDLQTLPEIKGAPSVRAANEQRWHDEEVRIRLKEGFRTLIQHPLNIFIATRLTVDEKISQALLSLRTEQIYVNAKDLDNPSKLQAAIRIPLVALVGGGIGIRPGTKGLEKTWTKALTVEQSKEALLHELIHVLLINQGVSANQVWETIRTRMIIGSEPAKSACENVIRRYLRAQEEIFVYTHLGELYSGFETKKDKYEQFIILVELLLGSHSAKIDQKKKVLNVQGNIGGGKKKMDWVILFKYPKSIRVSESDTAQLKELSQCDPGS